MWEICLNIAGYRCFRETFKKCVRLRVCHCLFVRACVCLCHPECPWVSWYILPRLRLGRSQVVCSSFSCGKMKFQFPAARSVGRIKRMRAEKRCGLHALTHYANCPGPAQPTTCPVPGLLSVCLPVSVLVFASGHLI